MLRANFKRQCSCKLTPKSSWERKASWLPIQASTCSTSRKKTCKKTKKQREWYEWKAILWETETGSRNFSDHYKSYAMCCSQNCLLSWMGNNVRSCLCDALTKRTWNCSTKCRPQEVAEQCHTQQIWMWFYFVQPHWACTKHAQCGHSYMRNSVHSSHKPKEHPMWECLYWACFVHAQCGWICQRNL